MKLRAYAPPNTLVQWVVYDRPRDCPDSFVVRAFLVEPGRIIPNAVAHRFPTLELARAALPEGLVRLARVPDDDPKIVEVWV